jgi:hypothetical protein
MAILAFFFANLLATRSASEAFACLRCSFDRCASFDPSAGSPFGTSIGSVVVCGGLLDLDLRRSLDEDGAGWESLDLMAEESLLPWIVLQRLILSFRLANLSWSREKVNSVSTHSRSCVKPLG